MPIGDYYSIISKRRIAKSIYKLLGTLDLHTHIRLKPIIAFLQKYFENSLNSQIRILEIGCGVGVNAFELCKMAEKLDIDLHYIGVDLSYKAISAANKVLLSFPSTKSEICFFHDDANRFLEKYKGSSFDLILLIDIIEHIKNPRKLLYLSKKFLNDNGLFIVSVPTPLYPKIFGRRFHNRIGHVVDGYSVSQLDSLFTDIGYQRIMYKYNTDFFSNKGCWLYYNKLNFNNKYFNFLKSLILYPFKFLDAYNNPQLSCSLCAVYGKKQ